MTTEIDQSAFDALTFDCYGTLIDWETGLLAGLRLVLAAHGVDGTDDELLEAYADAEATLEGGPYLAYREILAGGLRAIAARLGTSVTDREAAAFSGSVADWPAFLDSAAALARLKTRFRLGVLTNCDDDLFAASNRRLGVAFDWIVTAQQVRSYKPDVRNFAALFDRLAADGVRPGRILHVAQSLFHDHVPAKRLGLTTVWIDRRHGRPGSGATLPAEARPDATFTSMCDFAHAAVPLLGRGRNGRDPRGSDARTEQGDLLIDSGTSVQPARSCHRAGDMDRVRRGVGGGLERLPR